MIKLLFALSLLFLMAQVAGLAIELTLLEWETFEPISTYSYWSDEPEGSPPVHPNVKRLMRYHGVLWFDWHEEKGEFGFWRDGKWCPAR